MYPFIEGYIFWNVKEKNSHLLIEHWRSDKKKKKKAVDLEKKRKGHKIKILKWLISKIFMDVHNFALNLTFQFHLPSPPLILWGMAFSQPRMPCSVSFHL